MKVGLFVDTFNMGGAESVVLSLARELLSRQGYEPVIIHFGSEVLSKQCEKYQISDLVAPGHKFYKKTITLPLFAIIFQYFLRNNKIDVLHSHLYGSIVAAAPAAKIAGIKHIGTLHDIYIVKEKIVRILFLKLAALLGTKLIAVSRQMETFYREHGKFKEQSLGLIYNGVSLPESQHFQSNNIRSALEIDKNTLLVTCVARLVPLKRHDLLINAFAKLLTRTDLSCKLLLVGDGPERRNLERLAVQLDIAGETCFLGEREDVEDILSQSNIFVLASDTEGLSCSILEAMAAGLPIVATNVGGNSELVIHDQNGFLVSADDVNNLADKILQLIQDARMRERFGKNSISQVKNHFQWASTFNQYKLLYES